MAIKTEAPGHLSPWIPETDLVLIAAISKLGEEAAELAKACTRATMQGLDFIDHDGQPNFEKMAEEYADVSAAMAALSAVTTQFDGLLEDIELRANNKEAHLLRWFNLIREHRAKAPSDVSRGYIRKDPS